MLTRIASVLAEMSTTVGFLVLLFAGFIISENVLRGVLLGYSQVLLLIIGVSAGWLAVIAYLQRAARAEAKKVSMLLDAAPEAMIGVRDSGSIRFVNARVAEVFGYTEAELIDEQIEKLVPERFRAEHVPRRARYVQAPMVRPMGSTEALLARRKNGTEFPVEISLNRISTGREPVVLCVIRDVTEQRRTREALLEANRELESTVAAMRRRTHELRELTSVGELLQSCSSEHEIYPLVADALQRLFPATSGGLYLLNSSRTTAELAAQWGVQEHIVTRFAPQDCWGLRRSRAHRCELGHSVLRCAHSAPDRATGTVCIPMTAQGEAIGILCAIGSADVAEEPGALDQVMRALAEQCALASANLRLREAFRNQSIRDPLTGLFNRRFLEESFDRELHRAARQASPLSVLMIDLDRFKQYNDTFGHQSGDQALRQCCALLQRSVRTSDIVCRIGGEEIAVLLPDTPLPAALRVAEHVRAAIEQQAATQPCSKTQGSLTISVGVACSPEHGVSSETLLQAADLALYAAKRAGRNQVVSAARPDLSAAVARLDIPARPIPAKLEHRP